MNDEESELQTIYRTYDDTEVAALFTQVECPYCGHEWEEYDKSEYGASYVLTCENEGGGRKFKMYFDAS